MASGAIDVRIVTDVAAFALLAIGPLRDEGDEFTAASQRGGQRSVRPAVRVLSPESADDGIALGALAGGERICLDGLPVELAGSGHTGV